jgi:hypothetical protein
MSGAKRTMCDAIFFSSFSEKISNCTIEISLIITAPSSSLELTRSSGLLLLSFVSLGALFSLDPSPKWSE